MEHAFNVTAIKKKMKNPPDGQRIHYFFWGSPHVLNIEQIEEIEQIVSDEVKQMKKFLSNARKQIA